MTPQALSTLLIDVFSPEDTITVNTRWLQNQLLQRNRLALTLDVMNKHMTLAKERIESLRLAQSVYESIRKNQRILDINA